ncbi:glutaredoxin family protein [Thiomicrolovo sp. ZZH C-3]
MKMLMVMLVALQLWAGEAFPTLFAQMGDPLYRFAAGVGTMASDAKLGDSVNAYVRQAASVKETGLEAQSSGQVPARNAYLKELRQLQKSHDRLMIAVKRELLSAMKAGNEKRVVQIVSTEPSVVRDDPGLREKVVAFSKAKKLGGQSAFLDALVRDSKAEVRYAQNAWEAQTGGGVYHPQGRHPTVTVLGTPTCPYCIKTRRFLRERGIPFRDYNVRTSETGKRLFKEHGGTGVPLVLIGDVTITGHNPAAILRAYGK